jgi:hypothetical protein
MAEVPPSEFAAYPRPQLGTHGAREKLRALGEGYFGLSWVFLANLMLALGTPLLLTPVLVLPGLVALLVVIVANYRYNQKIAFGKGWPPRFGVYASIFTGISAILCCGIGGYVVMQLVASKEMRKYGVKTGFLGISKKNWIAAMEDLPSPANP